MEIKSCFDDSVLKVVEGTSLYGANLGGANLGGANLGEADLRGANLGGANLRGADLRGANLGGANLGGANLGGANLGGANLRGADLRGAKGILILGPLGSRQDFLYVIRTGEGWMCKTGCWWGTSTELRQRVLEVHAGSLWQRQYVAALDLLDSWELPT
jgi:hypothetical protein